MAQVLTSTTIKAASRAASRRVDKVKLPLGWQQLCMLKYIYYVKSCYTTLNYIILPCTLIMYICWCWSAHHDVDIKIFQHFQFIQMIFNMIQRKQFYLHAFQLFQLFQIITTYFIIFQLYFILISVHIFQLISMS